MSHTLLQEAVQENVDGMVGRQFGNGLMLYFAFAKKDVHRNVYIAHVENVKAKPSQNLLSTDTGKSTNKGKRKVRDLKIWITILKLSQFKRQMKFILI